MADTPHRPFEVVRQQVVRVHDCSKPDCRQKADRIPVLIVPAHPLSINKNYVVRNVMWLPLCAKHFNAASMRDFMSGEAIAGIQGSVTEDFHANNAQPDFNKAQMNFIFKNDPEFALWDLRQQQAIPN